MSSTEFDARSYWDKRLKRDWSLHGVGMLQLARSFNRWMYRVRRHMFRHTVRTLPVDITRSDVLDIGSGTGFYINLWRQLGARTTSGIDIADSAVARLREKFPGVAFERGDVSDELPFTEAAFDVVSAFDVLIHVVDDQRYERAMANVYRLLKPGGYFMFSEPFPHYKRVGKKHHLCRTLDEVQDSVQRNGFEIVSRRPMFTNMASPVDSTQQWRRDFWYKRLAPLLASERWGGVLGAAMYVPELLLTRLSRESPSMEIMVCRKPDAT